MTITKRTAFVTDYLLLFVPFTSNYDEIFGGRL
jgi:hypothetical protein